MKTFLVPLTSSDYYTDLVLVKLSDAHIKNIDDMLKYIADRKGVDVVMIALSGFEVEFISPEEDDDCTSDIADIYDLVSNQSVLLTDEQASVLKRVEVDIYDKNPLVIIKEGKIVFDFIDLKKSAEYPSVSSCHINY